MKEMPSFEKKESVEQHLIRLLKEKGAEDSETRSVLDEWTREQGVRVDKENKTIGAIDLNLKRARLYFSERGAKCKSNLLHFVRAKLKGVNTSMLALVSIDFIY